MGGRTERLWATAAAVASRPSSALVQERRRARFGFVWHEDNGEDNSLETSRRDHTKIMAKIMTSRRDHTKIMAKIIALRRDHTKIMAKIIASDLSPRR